VKFSAAPRPAHRVIPSQFPPIPVFDTVSTAADLKTAMDLEGWTNDRLVEARLNRLDQADWVYGIPNSSIVMAAFLHISPTGMRFNSGELGGWYAAGHIDTAISEVAHHLRRECADRNKAELTRTYRAYSCSVAGDYVDIRGEHATSPGLYADDSYAWSQPFGEGVRTQKHNGILFDSLRHDGGENVVVYRPKLISDITQADHFDIRVEIGSQKVGVARKTL
jgi:hypothetical protein